MDAGKDDLKKLEELAEQGLARAAESHSIDDIEQTLDGAFERSGRGRVLSMRPRRRWLVAAGFILLFGVALWWLLGGPRSSDPQSYFATYFAVPPLAAPNIQRAGTQSLPAALAEGIEAYERSDFEQALASFRNYGNTHEWVRIYEGISLLALNRAAEAEQILTEANGQTHGIEDVQLWYLALAKLKNDKAAAARQVLLQLVGDYSYHRQDAHELIDKLAN